MFLVKLILLLYLNEVQCQTYDRFTGKEVDGTPTFQNGTADTPGVCTMYIPPCNPKDFRSHDGTCNNLKRPIRGSRVSPFLRILPPAYANGGGARIRKDGSPLPLARRVRTAILQDGRVKSKDLTVAAYHSFEYLGGDAVVTNGPPDYLFVRQYCCTPAGAADPRCMPIIIPDDDPYLKNSDVRCMNFTRSETFQGLGCAPQSLPPAQINFGTSLPDLHLVYGTLNFTNTMLRTNEDGLMRTEFRKGREMPILINSSINNCVGNKANETECYLFGDLLSNFHPRFATLNIFFLLEHNRIARKLKKINPCWGDDKLYNISRKINIAEAQNILFYEVLATLFGKENLEKAGVLERDVNFVNEYDPYLEPLLYAETTVALRFFHASIEGRVKLYNKQYKQYDQFFQGAIILRSAALLEDDFNYEGLSRGLFFQMSADNDDNVDPDVGGSPTSNLLGRDDSARDFEQLSHKTQSTQDNITLHTSSSISSTKGNLKKTCGGVMGPPTETMFLMVAIFLINEQFFSGFFRAFDLIAADILRDRDMGIRPYNDYREYCGLPKARKFEDFADVMDYDRIDELRNVYNHVDDVDLLVGIHTERLLKGIHSGPTLLCIVIRQFRDAKRADRYWFERGDHHQAFTKGQLYQIRKSSFARLACDHSNSITDIQPNALLVPNKGNEVVPCKQIPKLNLHQWADPTCHDKWPSHFSDKEHRL